MKQTLTPPAGHEPYIVYLPGIEGSGALASQFLLQAEELFDITRLHYPGHSRLTLEEMADGCVQALAEQGRRSAIWLGDSFGGCLALLIALRHPEAAQGLVLAGAFTKSPNPTRLLLAAKIWDASPEKWKMRYLRRRFARLVRRNPSRITKTMVDEFLVNGQFDFVSWRLRLVAAFDLRKELPRIECPALYLGGEEDGLVDTQEEARVLRETVSDSRTFLFPGCGHAVLGERSVECLEILNAFLPRAKRAAA